MKPCTRTPLHDACLGVLLFAAGAALTDRLSPRVAWLAVAGLVLCLGRRSLAPLLFLCAGLVAGHGLVHDPLTRATALGTVTAAVESPTTQAGQWHRTSLRTSEAAGLGATAVLLEPASHPPRSRGEVLRVRALVAPPGPARNPGGHPDPVAVLRASHPDQVQVVSGPGLARLPARWLARRLDGLPPHLGAWLRALFLGEVDAIPADTRRRFRNTGVYHLLVVSGWHVAIAGALLCFLLPRGWMATFGALAGVILFAWLTGARPPVIRAASVFTIYLAGTTAGRAGAAELALALAFLGFASWQPAVLTDVGFQLSFVAVLGILAGQRHRPPWSPRGSGAGLQLWMPVMRALQVSWFATLATAPFTAAAFGTVSPWSPLTTLMVAPAVLLLMAGGLVSLALQELLPAMGHELAVLLEGLAIGVEESLRWVDGWPGTPLRCATPSLRMIVACVAVLWCWLRDRPRLALATLALAGGMELRPGPGPGSRVVLLDVGHGQCALVQTAHRTDLIDAGGGGRGTSPGLQSELDRALRALHVHRLDGLFLSHLDRDHTGLAPALLQSMEVGELVIPAAVLRDRDRDPFLGELLRLAADCGVGIHSVRSGDRVGPHEVLWPADGEYLSDNERSLVIATTVGVDRVLFPGDLTSFGLIELAADLRQVSILVLPHHGNPDPGLPCLLSRTAPLLALASRGAPLDAATRRDLRRHHVPVASTFERGALELRWDADPARRPHLLGHVTSAPQLR